MTNSEKSPDTIIDYITGKTIPDIGAEANRQAVERFLVAEKGFAKEDIDVDVGIKFVVKGEMYQSKIDLVVCVDGKRFMVVKCAAGSLGSREREIIAASRLLDSYQIPYAVVSDGKTAIVLDAVSGKKVGNSLDAIWSRDAAKKQMSEIPLIPFPEERSEREKLIFRSYDMMDVNR